MKIIWTYLKPFRKWLFISMGLAATAQVLELVDPIIFGKIIEGNHASLVKKKGFYYAMWRQQIGERESYAHYSALGYIS